MLGGQYFRSHKPSRKRHYDDFCFGITDHQEAAFVDVVRTLKGITAEKELSLNNSSAITIASLFSSSGYSSLSARREKRRIDNNITRDWSSDLHIKTNINRSSVDDTTSSSSPSLTLITLDSSSPDSMITHQTMHTISSNSSETFYTPKQQKFCHSTSNSDSSTPTTPVRIHHTIADDNMTFMTPNTSKCAHEDRSVITIEQDDDDNEEEKEDGIETVVTVSMQSLSMQSFQTAHASFPVSTSPIRHKRQKDKPTEVQADTTRASILNTITPPPAQLQSQDPQLQYQPRLPAAMLVNREAPPTLSNNQHNQNQITNRPPSSIIYPSNRTPLGLRPRSSIEQLRSRFGVSSFSSPNQPHQHQYQHQHQHQQYPSRLSYVTTPSVTSSAASRDTDLPRDSGDNMVVRAGDERTLKKNNLSFSAASKNLPLQSLSHQQNRIQTQARAFLRGPGDAGDGFSSSTTTTPSLFNSSNNIKNNTTSSLFSSQKDEEGAMHKRRSIFSSISSNTTSTPRNTMGFNMSSLTSSAISSLGSGGGKANKEMQIEEYSLPSPDLSSVGNTKTAVGALVARQDLENIKNNWNTRRSSKDNNKPKTAVGALVARKSHSNRARGGGKSRISKSNGRKSLKGQENDDVSHTRGKMKSYLSTLPSWFNGSSDCPTTPMMREGLKETKPGSSCIDTGVGVLGNKYDSNNRTSRDVLNQMRHNADATNEGQSLNTSALSFVPPRHYKQEEYKKQKGGKTNNATLPLVANLARISIGSGFHRKKHVTNQKNKDDDGTGYRWMANDCSTSYVLLDDSQSKVSPPHIHAGSSVIRNDEDDDESSSSSESVCKSFNELLKQRQQDNMNNNDKDDSDKNRCQVPQGSSSSNYHTSSPPIDEWNEYEKYQEEQERKMSSLPTFDCVDADTDDDERNDDEGIEEDERSYSSRHELFESYDSLMGGTALSNNKPMSSYDFSPVENEIHAGGFCIRDEITSCVSDISYNTGMQSGDYQFNHQPPHHMHYMEVPAQNSAFTGPSPQATPSAIDSTGFSNKRTNTLFSSLKKNASYPLQQEQDQYLRTTLSGFSANAAGRRRNNDPSGDYEYSSSSSNAKWISSDDDLLKRKKENQCHQKEQLVIRLIRRLQDNASLVYEIDNVMQGKVGSGIKSHAFQAVNPFMRTSIEKEGIITGYSLKNRSDILRNLNEIVLKINGGGVNDDVMLDNGEESDGSLHQAIQFVICLVKSASVYGNKAKEDQWRPKDWFRKAIQVEEDGEQSLTPFKPAVEASALSGPSAFTPASNRSYDGLSSTARLTPTANHLPEGPLLCRILVIVSTIVQKLTVALEECTSSTHLIKTIDEVKRNYLQLLRIPNDHISRLNDGFSLSSGMLTNDIHPVQSDSDESQPTYIKEEIPSSIVKPNCIGTLKAAWAMEYSDIQDSPMIFPTIVKVPNEENVNNDCTNLTNSVDVDDTDKSCLLASKLETRRELSPDLEEADQNHLRDALTETCSNLSSMSDGARKASLVGGEEDESVESINQEDLSIDGPSKETKEMVSTLISLKLG